MRKGRLIRNSLSNLNIKYIQLLHSKFSHIQIEPNSNFELQIRHFTDQIEPSEIIIKAVVIVIDKIRSILQYDSDNLIVSW